MTTLTTRPLPLPPLPLALARPMTCNDRSPSIGSPTPPLSIKTMHPDNVILSGHGVASPQLSSSSGGGGVFCDNLSKNCDRSSHHLPPLPSLAVPAEARDRINRGGRSPFGRSAGNKSVLSDVSYNCGTNADDDNCTDRMSCCSDDSELSVGQEGCASNGSDPNLKSFSETVDSGGSTGGRQVADDSESADNTSNLSDEQRLESAGDHMLSDDMSNDSSPHPSRETDPAIVSPSMRIPVPIVRPSPTRLQEEFLRKSHLYAEELMKQQMQFMAAARASAFSLRHATISPEVGKVGFRPHVKSSMQPDISDSLVNFSGIHSHLSAISKISSQLSATDSALSKLTAFGVMSGRDVSHSPPFANQMGLNHPINARHPFINNNLNETNLKFSIDNILKADFGRRITDPLLKRSGNSSCSGNSANGGKNHGSRKSRNSEKHDNAPVDLTNLVTVSSGNSASAESSPSPAFEKQSSSGSHGKSALSGKNSASSTVPSAIPTPPASTASATPTASASGSEATTNNSSSSGGPMVWPAWVYCTRYSDRPSSGRSPRSSGPRTRKPKKPPSEKGGSSSDEKRPRTAFSGPQLARLKHEFNENRYLTERRRQQLSAELGLNEAQIKIWFQNKRAKIKKASGTKNPLALQLMAQGLYNHSTVPLTREEEELQELQAKNTS